MIMAVIMTEATVAACTDGAEEAKATPRMTERCLLTHGVTLAAVAAFRGHAEQAAIVEPAKKNRLGLQSFGPQRCPKRVTAMKTSMIEPSKPVSSLRATVATVTRSRPRNLARSCQACREEETMLSVNKVILMGVLADRPLVREIEGGAMMVGLSVVTSRGWHDDSHEQTDDKEWHRVVITHPDLAGYAESPSRKGRSGLSRRRAADDVLARCHLQSPVS